VLVNLSFIVPEWPAPENIVALTTTRQGGVSVGPYQSFNLAAHVGDAPEHVATNRQKLITELKLPVAPYWLQQVHGTTALCLPDTDTRVADASYTEAPEQICAVLTADCLPVLLCNRQGTEVAAIHAGWKGLAAGVIEACVTRLNTPVQDLLAWLGPAISQRNFEVGRDVLAAFVTVDPAHQQAFIPATKSGNYQADLYLIARQKLAKLGISAVYGGDYCTYADKELFYSYRRDGEATGRMASLIYFK
jgi:polyphenol oxidase